MSSSSCERREGQDDARTTGRLCNPGEGLALKYTKRSGVESAPSGLSDPGDPHPIVSSFTFKVHRKLHRRFIKIASRSQEHTLALVNLESDKIERS